MVELPVRSSVVLFGMVRYGPVPGKTVSVFQMNRNNFSSMRDILIYVASFASTCEYSVLRVSCHLW